MSNCNVGELWKWPTFLGGRYRVSSQGRIFGCYRRGMLKPKLDKDGYENVILHVDGERKYLRVHRLVLMVFSEDMGAEYDVDHINGIRDDNRLENLRWMKKDEHVRHRINSGHIARGERQGISKFTEKTVRGFVTELESFKKTDGSYQRGAIKALAQKYEISLPTAYKIKEGKNWGWVNAS